MSLLMEALRKAEEAKSKATQEQPTEAQQASEAIVPTEVQTIETISVATDDDPSLDMLPMEPSLESKFQAETAELASTSEPQKNRQDHPQREDKQTASALFQAKRPAPKKDRSKLLVLVALVLLIPFSGMFYWLYSDTNSSSYPTLPPSSPTMVERGFLGESITQEAPPQPQADMQTPLFAEAEIQAEPEQTAPIPKQETNLDVPETVLLNTSSAPSSALPATQESPDTATPVIETGLRLTRTDTSESIDPQLQSAFNNYQQGNLDLAQNQYQAVLKQQGNDRNAMLGLASVYLKKSNTASAQVLYSRLLKLNPQDPLARAGILESSQAADPLRQESELKSLITLHPDIAPLAFALGNLYASQNRWSEAQNEYFNALRIAKANNTGAISPDYAFNLAIGLERLNQLQPAYRYYQDALELSRHSPPGFDLELLNRRLTYLEQILQ